MLFGKECIKVGQDLQTKVLSEQLFSMGSMECSLVKHLRK